MAKAHRELLGETKVNGAEAHSSGKINLPSSQTDAHFASASQPTLSYRVGIHLDVDTIKTFEQGIAQRYECRGIGQLYAHDHTLGVLGVEPHEQTQVHGVAHEHIHHHPDGDIQCTLVIRIYAYALGNAHHHLHDGHALR